MANTRQLSFSGGEISPSLHARVDQVKYSTGLRTCKNFMVMRHGGVTNRPGTGFIGEVKDSTKKIRLIPFIFNNDQTYVLEFGDLYMRAHRNGAPVLEAAKTITGITQADPPVVTITSHGYSDGEEVYISGVVGMTELNGRTFKVANATTHTFTLQYMTGADVDATGFGAYSSAGTAERVYTIATPYVEADLPTLQYVQEADVITIVHPNYAIRELSRSGHTAWTLATVTFGAVLSAPTGLASDAVGTAQYYKVTAVNTETSEESLPSAAAGSTTETSNLSWTAVTGAQYYNVYKLKNGRYGWIGIAGTNAFKDDTYVPDPLDTPPDDRQVFTGAGNYPSTCAIFQQRMVFANTDNNPEGVWATKSGLRKNIMISTPSQADDAVTWAMAGQQVNEIQHLLDLGKFLVFTTSGEWAVEGDTAGILRPGEINPKHYTSNGSGILRPLIVDGSALYVQARGSVIRDLGYDFQTDGYKGNELTIFASHLFDKYTLVDWAYQQIPHSVVWAVRSDGVLLGLTYVREHQVAGWHRHYFDGATLPDIDYYLDGTYLLDGEMSLAGGMNDAEVGLVENVCVVPEGSEDVLYLCVKRIIGGVTKRYIERMKTRQVNDIEDFVGMDCSLSYDGRNTGATTMTLSGGSTWAYDEDLTLTASTAYFSATEVGNEIHLTDDDGSILRCRITAYSSTTAVTVRPNRTVPTDLRNLGTTNWGRAVDVVSGLWHIEGQMVSVLVDGLVSANPNNPAYGLKAVADGQVTFDDPHMVIHVGLPIVADIETLNIDTPQGNSMTDKKKNITKVTLMVEDTRGLWAGADFDRLTELKIRNAEGYDDPVALATGTVDLNITGEFNNSGKVCIRQTDPLPISVLSIVPSGFIPSP